MVGMASANMGVRAIRQQIASAVDLFVNPGSSVQRRLRRMTYITELTGMEGDVITMQDIFVFDKMGITENGKVMGRFRATGIRPRFYDRLQSSGITLSPEIFQRVVEINFSKILTTLDPGRRAATRPVPRDRPVLAAGNGSDSHYRGSRNEAREPESSSEARFIRTC